MVTHSDDILMFNSTSADKKPGMGVMEAVADGYMYQHLAKKKDWRKMLSNEYACELDLDGVVWPSVEHMVLAHNYQNDPIVYESLKVKDACVLSKLKRKDYDEDVLKRALTLKFSTEPFKSVLLATKGACLTNWKRGINPMYKEDGSKYVSPNILCSLLMELRESMQTEYASADPVLESKTEQEANEELAEVVVTNSSTNHLELKILSKKDIDDFDGFISKYNKEENKSVNVLTKYEKTNIIGVRMEQLSMGCDTYISHDLAHELSCVKKIALEEFEQRKIPYIICRSMPNNVKEYWKLSDLIYVE